MQIIKGICFLGIIIKFHYKKQVSGCHSAVQYVTNGSLYN